MGNPGPILAHMVTPRNSDLCIHRQTLETRQGNDSIKALCKCISPLFQVLRPCATLFLPYSKFSPIYGIVGKWKENRKLFTFLNDAIDLRKRGIKNEIQQLKANCTLILRYLDHLIQLKNQLKKYGFHNFNTTLTLRHDFNIPARLKHSEYGHPRSKSASGCGPPFADLDPLPKISF